MTTQKTKTETAKLPDHNSDNPQEQSSETLDVYDALRLLLAPYEPAADSKSCDKRFSSQEIYIALENHYGKLPVGLQEIVAYMTELGYICANTGELSLEWLMKNRDE